MNMHFLQLSFWPGLLLAFAVFAMIVILLEKRFFTLVRRYWFYKRSLFSYLSSLFLLLGMGVLLMSLLDARGPEEKIKAEVPTERTIILIDTSASMLAEDVKPSRLQKAVLIAKHFARKAAGHQIAIVAFAEIQKKIIPFTNDLDLIDARLDSIKGLRNHYGSSALSLAIQESVQYFREVGDVRGNILVLTDGEETADGVKLNVPKEVHVALVGVGTSQGGRIPLEDSQGLRFGYKKNQGKDIITKLNEKFFQSTASDLPSGKYWLANSYSLPSDEIVEFFKSEMVKGANQQDMIMRPVMMEWIVLPALALLILSYFFKALGVFTLGICFLILPVQAQDEDKEVAIPEQVSRQLDRLQKGELSRLEKIKLADDLYQAGQKPQALDLYKENLKTDKIDSSVPPEAYLNYGTSLLDHGDASQAFSLYDKLSESMPESKRKEQLKETITRNSLTYFKKKEEQKKKEEKEKKEKKEDKEDKDQKGEKDKKEGNDGKEGKDQKDQQGGDKSKPDQKGKQDPKDQKGESEKEKKEKAEQAKKDQEKKDKDGEEDKDDKSKEGEQPKDDEPKKPLPPRKLPAKLKQLMSDDRQLQMKVIENGTRDLNKRKSRTSKDW